MIFLHPTADMHVLSNCRHRDLAPALQSGVVVYLTKPFNETELLSLFGSQISANYRDGMRSMSTSVTLRKLIYPVRLVDLGRSKITRLETTRHTTNVCLPTLHVTQALEVKP
jgi:CheY-like chemotaxis protein